MFTVKFKHIQGTPFNQYDKLSTASNELLKRIHNLVPGAPSAEMLRHCDFAAYVLFVAERKRTDAGFNGSYNDGGASDLERQVEAWISGLGGHVPQSFASLEQSYNRDTDDEYTKYLELKKKFG